MNGDLFFIILIVLIILYTYCDNKETFADTTTNTTDQIKTAIREVYNADVESIRNLSEVSKKLQAGGLTVPGNLSALGNLNVTNALTLNTVENPPVGFYSLKIPGPQGDSTFFNHNAGNIKGNWIRGRTEFNGDVFLSKLEVTDQLNIKGAKNGNTPGASTHFNYTDGNNYIRGNTNLDGTLQVYPVPGDANSNQLNIGDRLKLGYHNDYSWIQSHGSKPLNINPLGNNINMNGTTQINGDLVVNGRIIIGDLYVAKHLNYNNAIEVGRVANGNHKVVIRTPQGDNQDDGGKMKLQVFRNFSNGWNRTYEFNAWGDTKSV